MERKVKDVKELKLSSIYRMTLKRLDILTKPSSDLAKILDNVESIVEKDRFSLEKEMTSIIRWQNYLTFAFTLADVLCTLAEEQKSLFWALAVANTSGTINEKKDLAKKDEKYLEAVDVYLITKQSLKIIEAKRKQCESVYALFSRILTSRINDKGIDT